MNHDRSDLPKGVATLVDLLRWRAQRQPDQHAYTFLRDGETAAGSLTYAALDRRARAIGAALCDLAVPGARALLLYPPGFDYLAAFFGCLYGGVVAVPAYPPNPARLARTLPRLRAITLDAQPLVALTTSAILPIAGALAVQDPAFGALRWLATDALTGDLADTWLPPEARSATLALLQYTSGSTAAPKGVMLAHANLLHNSAAIRRCFAHTPESRGVIWLPPYHDMGLIGGILQPLFAGFPVTLMSPVDFLQRPLRWLQAISRDQATTSGGPNFAYDLCVRKTTPEQRAALDLRSWKVAFTGAEPVRAEALERFAAAFAPCGFRSTAFYPCYGLAEATLIVAGGAASVPPVVRAFERAALQQGQAIAAGDQPGAYMLVGCGQTLVDQSLAIVDQGRTRCQSAQIGEIWLRGPSVAQGYWERPEETARAFQAVLMGESGRWLRTGDLGFVQDGELFVTGRLKDLIIIRGRNHYPQDIELTVERSHPALRPGCGAAFAVEAAGEERLAVVQEVERQFRSDDADAVMRAIRQALAEQHELQAYAVVLLRPGSIPKTSSGKIQRYACRAAFLDGSLEVVRSSVLDEIALARHEASAIDERPLGRADLLALAPHARRPLLEAYLQTQVAQLLGNAPSPLDPWEPISAAGLDSLAAVELQHRIEAGLGVGVPLARLLEGISVAELADELLARLDATPDAVRTAPAASAPVAEHPLSPGQQALWFLYQLAPDSAAYIIARAVRILTPLDVPALHRAFQALVDRHPALRTTFHADAGAPVQRVHERHEVAFRVEAATWSDRRLAARLAEAAAQPFDLERGPLLRVQLFARSEREHTLLLAVHHIVADLWSLAVLTRELGVLYAAFAADQPSPLPNLPVQYADYAVWLQGSGVGSQGSGDKETPYGGVARRQGLPRVATRGDKETRPIAETQSSVLSPLSSVLQSPLQAHLAYWRAQLGGELAPLELPLDHPRPPVQTYRGAAYAFQLDHALSGRIKALARAAGATLYMALLAAFQVLLYRYSGQKNLLVGSPFRGRSRADERDTVGYLVNPVVLRADLAGNPAFTSFLDQVRRTVLAAIEHEEYPFAWLVERLQPVRDPGRTPLFQVMFILQQIPLFDDAALAGFALGRSGARMTLGELVLESVALPQPAAQFDLTLTMAESADELLGSFEYNADLFDEATIARMAGHLRTLLEGAVVDPERGIAQLPLLTPSEHQQLLFAWNAPGPGVRGQGAGVRGQHADSWCIHDLFESQVTRTSDAVALVFDRPTTNDQPLDAARGRRPATNDQRPTTNDEPATCDLRPATCDLVTPSPPHPVSLSPLHPFTPSPLHPFTQHLTYQELNHLANQVAHYLQSLGVGPEARVGICMARTPELLVALLGVLKAGGAYVPLDPAYPAERLAFMLVDSQAAVLITTTDHRPPTTDHRPPTTNGTDTIYPVPTTNDPEPRTAPFQESVLDDDLITQNSKLKTQNYPHPFTPSPSVVDLRADWPMIAQASTENLYSGATPDNLAYVIYTSGSTGRPKGVAIAHQSTVALLHWAREVFAGELLGGVLASTSICFDLSVFELFAPLSCGGTVLLAENVLQLGVLLGAPYITLLNSVPSALAELLRLGDLPAAVRTVNLAGEPLSLALAQQLYRQGQVRQVFNLYGPSESTTYSTAALVAKGSAVPPTIGRPIAGTQVYVLDEQLQPVPIGVVGELYIGGAGLARGYLGRPDLTAERFVPNPFGQGMGDRGWGMGGESSIPHPSPPPALRLSPIPRLYKTGDLARWRADGQLEFLGRIDQQVKLRGYRIELGEIEAALERHSAVRAAVVALREDAPGGLGLVAYVVPKIEDRGLKIEDSVSDAPDRLSAIGYRLSSELRVFLKDKLPDYMLPAAFVMLDALPLLPNGKVDRAALPASDSGRLEQETIFEAPRTPAEELLAGIWAELLGLERIGVHDNFFALGGHSLLATRLLARVRAAFQVVLPLRSLFEAPSVAELAERISAAPRVAHSAQPPLLPVARDGALPLSFAQQRLWFLDQLEPGNPAYNMPSAVSLAGALDIAALARSLCTIVRRHEVLRARFLLSPESQPAQLIAPMEHVPLPLIELRGWPAAEREAVARRLAAAEARRPFDLARGPLIRATVLRLGADDHVLLLTMHHIAADGWSIGVLMREIGLLYPACAIGQLAPLPPLPIQYADYAVWQRAWLEGSGVRGQGSGDTETRRQGDKETGIRGQESGVRGQGATAPVPPPAGGRTEGGRSQESDVGEGQTQNSKLKTQNSPLEAQLAYWRTQLAGLPALQLPADHPLPPVATSPGAQHRFGLSSPLAARLERLSRRAGITLFMTLLAAFQVLLARYSGQDDLAVGTPIAGRTQAETERLIGCFVNTLVLRADLSGNPMFESVLARVRETCLGAYAHQDLPFEQLVEALAPARDLGRNPLFQVMFTLQDEPLELPALPGLALRLLEAVETTAKFDLTLTVETSPGQLIGTLEYRRDLFGAVTVERMARHFQTLLEQLAAQPTLRIGDLALLTAAERRQLLVEWNASQALQPRAGCIHQLVAAQAVRTPEAVAVTFVRGQGSGVRGQETRRQGDKETRSQESGVRSQESEFLAPNPQSPIPNPQSATLSPQSSVLSPQSSVLSPEQLTYHELNVRANRLAHHLRALGVGPEMRVGLCMERSLELLIGLLGILKAGGAYVPLDPAYPEERLAFMLQDSQAAVLITSNHSETRRQGDKALEEPGTAGFQEPRDDDELKTQNSKLKTQSSTPSPPHLVTLSRSWPAIALCAADDPVDALDPANLAYVIYTSGSTGRPKGVAITHRSATVLLEWAGTVFEAQELSGMLAATSIGFDLSVFELFAPLSWGGKVILAEDVLQLPALPAAETVTLVNTVPSALAELLRVGGLPDSVRTVNLAGEPLQSGLVQQLYQRETVARVFNLYGPSEDTTYSTCALIEREALAAPPIGRPIACTQVYVLDHYLQPVPVGLPGELCIGGDGLARGYLGRPDLTAERFVPNPFAGGMGDKRSAGGGLGWGMEAASPSPIPHPPSPGTRLYRTGDLARWRADGNLEFLGRRDEQVKLRGYRIELGEIEAALAQHPTVREAVALAREDAPGDRRLVAYVVPKIEDRGLKIEDSVSEAPEPLSSILYPLSSELRDFLKERLPGYMVPSAFVALDALPLTPSGKIDRRALLALDPPGREARAGAVAPRTPMERQVAEICAEVLGVAQVGIHDNFFDLGGHSLLAIRAIARLRSAFQVDLPLRILFEAPTVASLSSVIERAAQRGGERRAPAITRLSREQYRVKSSTRREPHQDAKNDNRKS